MLVVGGRHDTPVGCLSCTLYACRHMLQFNPDNYKYHQGLRQALDLMPDVEGTLTEYQRDRLTLLYDGLQNKYPRSSAARRIPLDFKVCLLRPSSLPSGRCICFQWAHIHKSNSVPILYYKCFSHSLDCWANQLRMLI